MLKKRKKEKSALLGPLDHNYNTFISQLICSVYRRHRGCIDENNSKSAIKVSNTHLLSCHACTSLLPPPPPPLFRCCCRRRHLPSFVAAATAAATSFFAPTIPPIRHCQLIQQTRNFFHPSSPAAKPHTSNISMPGGRPKGSDAPSLSLLTPHNVLDQDNIMSVTDASFEESREVCGDLATIRVFGIHSQAFYRLVCRPTPMLNLAAGAQ